MAKQYDLVNLKLAQLHSKNLDIIKKEIIQTVIVLKPFISYKSVQRILNVMQDEIAIIDAHLNQFNKIEKTKGEIADEQ